MQRATGGSMMGSTSTRSAHAVHTLMLMLMHMHMQWWISTARHGARARTLVIGPSSPREELEQLEMRRRGRARELRSEGAPCVYGACGAVVRRGTTACGGVGTRLLHARHVEQLAKDEDARVLDRLADEARAPSALRRLRQQAELLQRRTVLGGGGHAATCASSSF